MFRKIDISIVRAAYFDYDGNVYGYVITQNISNGTRVCLASIN